jgi:hypothetical protein
MTYIVGGQQCNSRCVWRGHESTAHGSICTAIRVGLPRGHGNVKHVADRCAFRCAGRHAVKHTRDLQAPAARTPAAHASAAGAHAVKPPSKHQTAHHAAKQAATTPAASPARAASKQGEWRNSVPGCRNPTLAAITPRSAAPGGAHALERTGSSWLSRPAAKPSATHAPVSSRATAVPAAHGVRQHQRKQTQPRKDAMTGTTRAASPVSIRRAATSTQKTNRMDETTAAAARAAPQLAGDELRPHKRQKLCVQPDNMPFCRICCWAVLGVARRSTAMELIAAYVLCQSLAS